MTLPVEVNPLMMGGGGYKISRSLRFRSSATAYLTRTLGTPTSNTVWTYSIWVKRGQLGTAQTLLSSGGQTLSFTTTGTVDALSLYSAGNPVATSASVYRDPSAWYHIVASSSGSVITVYVNNVSRLTYTGTLTNINSASAHYIGRYGNSATDYFDGYLAEVNFIDGQALTPSSFGENDATTGVWKPKAYSGSYGTNGFYLKFADNSAATAAAIGKDSSSNGNNWTPNNISVTAGVTYDSMIDTPTPYDDGGTGRGNYATLNPLWKQWAGTPTVTNGNLTYNAANTTDRIAATICATGGKYYFEVTKTDANAVSNNLNIGVANSNTALSTSAYVGNPTSSGATVNEWMLTDRGYACNTSTYTNLSGTIGTITQNAVVQVCVDTVNGLIWWGINNTFSGSPSAGTGAAFSNIPSSVVPVICTEASGYVAEINFGQRPFTYTPPSGFKALNTQNLPVPVIAAGSAHMNVALDTGANIKTTSQAFYTYYLEWLKDRANANNHQLADTVRGNTAIIQSNTLAAETTYTAPTGNSVGWVWNAGAASASNTSGTITSTVSANVTAGFSVVTYTGTGANATVGHGLGVAPNLIIVKIRNSAIVADWAVYHSSLGGTQLLRLNTTGAAITSSTAWNNTSPTSSVFSIGTLADTNYSASATYVAYCFSAVSGYSAFGSYTGNGSADGPFVFTGFRPKFIMVKCTNQTYSWEMFDTSRNTYNSAINVIYANLSNAEASYTAGNGFDLNSNGFKLRDNYVSLNGSGNTYIYMAFAEVPFKYALGR